MRLLGRSGKLFLAGLVSTKFRKTEKMNRDNVNLRSSAPALSAKVAGKHIDALRLFYLAQEGGFQQITEEDRIHLHDCEECQCLVQVFARQATQPPRLPEDKPGSDA